MISLLTHSEFFSALLLYVVVFAPALWGFLASGGILAV